MMIADKDGPVTGHALMLISKITDLASHEIRFDGERAIFIFDVGRGIIWHAGDPPRTNWRPPVRREYKHIEITEEELQDKVEETIIAYANHLVDYKLTNGGGDE